MGRSMIARYSQNQLIDLDALPELLILVADELDRFVVQESLIDADRERLRVRLGVVNRHVDFELSEHGTAESLSEARLVAVWAAAHVEPAVVGTGFIAAQIVRLDDERIAFPSPDRVAVPPGLRFPLWRKFATI